ncbi:MULTISPECIES: hypothetical protein [Paracoccaceae]|jgi:hypothetical protein|uniref:hypothetical protein n=1 Tax=Rhodobacterales TaxID=204455 RepID=UPI001B1ED694|nr:hypothetical protein [Boseongicola sp. H5]MBO6602573.1 hypothetical protein [Roseicyclus sp.]MBO6624296.1 hypothetical protein [Roseicyclus sp.]MBO6921544.1 hypothetical protein [Roseicyclus sp.]
MMFSFNTVILILLTLYVIWMGFSEYRKEKTSAASLNDAQLKRFNEAYTFGRPPEEYADDIRAHAVLAQRARIRKTAAIVILIAVLFIFLFMGP